MTGRQNPSVASVRTVLPIELSGSEFHLEARAYLCDATGLEAIALLHRNSDSTAATHPLVAILRGCLAGDIFHSLRCGCHRTLKIALDAITAAPLGVLIYLPDLSPKGTINRHAAPRDDTENLKESVAHLCMDAKISRETFYRLATQIIRDFGFSDLRLLASEAALDALDAGGLRIIEKISLHTPPAAHDRQADSDFTVAGV